MYRSICIFIFALFFAGNVYAQTTSLSADIKKCEGGDFYACHDVGLAFQNGEGVKQDYKKAMQFFEQSCKGEFQGGCAAIAFMHYKGLGVPQNPKEAAKLFKVSCQKGYRGCLHFGEMHIFGTGVKKDLNVGLKLINRGCGAGDAPACKRLSNIYNNGHLVRRDRDTAEAYFGKACTHGDGEVCYRLGEMYRVGNEHKLAFEHQQLACKHGLTLGCWTAGRLYEEYLTKDENYDEAVRLYQKGCEKKDALSCNALGVMHHKGRGVEKSARLSVQLYEKACDLDNSMACRNAGIRYEEARGVKEDPKMAFKLLTKACDLGDSPDGCNRLARYYVDGTGTVKNEKKAIKIYKQTCKIDGSGCLKIGVLFGKTKREKEAPAFFEEGCRKNYGFACTKIGAFREDGFNVEKDLELAEKHYKKACNLDDEIGCYLLGRIFYGKGPKRDDNLATTLFRKGCRLDGKAACRGLGTAYKSGNGVKKNINEANRLYLKACKADDALGCKYLAQSYKDGLGFKKDKDKATTFFGEACSFENASSCHEAGLILKSQRKHQKAAEYFVKACDANFANACVLLAYYHFRKVLPDEKKAMYYYKKACDNGNTGGCIAVGQRYRIGQFVKIDKRKARTIFKETCLKNNYACTLVAKDLLAMSGWKKNIKRIEKLTKPACEKGLLAACIQLGILHQKIGDADSTKKAIKHFTFACEKNDFFCGELASSYSNGIGVKKDLTKGKSLFTKASASLSNVCDAGSASVCIDLGRMLKTNQPILAKQAYQKACTQGATRGCELAKKLR